MGAPIISFLLLSGILTIGSESEPSSRNQENMTSLKEKVLQLEDRISSLEISIPETLQAATEQLLITVLDEMEIKLENYARTNNVSEMGATLRKELQTLLSNHSLSDDQLKSDVVQMNQNLRNLAFQMEKLSSQSEDVQTSLDSTFTLRTFVKGDWPFYVSTVSCASEVSLEAIEFSRVLDTGSSGSLPTGAKIYSRGRAAVLDLSGAPAEDRRGVYECAQKTPGKRSRIPFVLNLYGWFNRPKIASIGDRVRFFAGLSNDPTWRWFHDGERVFAGDGRQMLTIAGVRKEDAGIYELYKEGDRRNSQWFFRLIVKGCPANLYGEKCDKNCTTCYNGGLCHEYLGTCVCPQGFEGERCEVACGEGRVGSNCSELCEGGHCKGQLFCKPDPYGCSCASGYGGYECEDKCDERSFGANCEQSCHCKEESCDPYTGACSRGCSQGWSGQSCQIPVEI